MVKKVFPKLSDREANRAILDKIIEEGVFKNVRPETPLAFFETYFKSTAFNSVSHWYGVGNMQELVDFASKDHFRSGARMGKGTKNFLGDLINAYYQHCPNIEPSSPKEEGWGERVGRRSDSSLTLGSSY